MKNFTHVALCCFWLFISISSCRKTALTPRQVQVQNSSTPLIGWWQPQNYLTQAKLYFGADGFFYNDTISGKAPIAGFWKKNNDTITCSAQVNGATELQFVISHLDNNSLQLSRVGIGGQQSYSKLDTPAITSPPMKTVAGTGILGNTGDGGLAVNANINGFSGVATDKHGNIYIAQTANGVIREISIADGTIKTIVGNGRAGRGAYYSTPIMATCDYSFSPYNLAVDSADNVYFSDIYASAVYKLSRADNMIRAVAGNGVAGFSGDGGSATSASLNVPNGLALDKNGNLFIVDMNNVRIRKVSLSTGVITTVAGSGQGTPNGDGGLAVNTIIDPFGISLDNDGNIYFVNGNTISKVSATTNIITRIAGASYTSLNNYKKGDGGPAINAMFRFPYGINVTASGDIFVSDNVDNTVRKIDHATNLITTVAGTGYAGLNTVGGIHATGYSIYNPSFLATDPSGKMLYISAGDNRLFGVGPF